MEDDYSYDFGYDYSTDSGTTEIENTALPGQPGYGWKYYSDGTTISPDGKYYQDGRVVYDPSATGGLSGLGGNIVNALMGAFKKPGGGVDWQKVATVGGGLAGLMGVGKTQQRPTGYQGSIPKYTAVREQVQNTYDPTRRPGSGGQRYFSDTTYAPKESLDTAKTAAVEQAAGLAALNVSNPARQTLPTPEPAITTPETTQPVATQPASKVIEALPVPKYAQGGIAGLKDGKYLNGATDGMGDKIRTTIEGKQPAALSHGEFVVPADVVSHLGNGNSEAGAKKLYEMMDKVRQARTGTRQQGKQINPNKYLPA